MPADQVEAVASKPGGWAVSLQLAAIAGRSQRVQRGGDLPGVRAKVQVLDYAFHEVLAAEEPSLVEVLMGVLVVERLSPSLVLALTQAVS